MTTDTPVIGLRAAAALTSLSYQRIKWYSMRGEFPKPTGQRGQAHVFSRADILAWERLHKRRREPKPKKHGSRQSSRR